MADKEFAIIVAGGKGLRLPGDIPKQFISIAGVPVLMRTISAFRSYRFDIDIILVLPAGEFRLWANLCRQYDFMDAHTVVAGGATRFQSVKNGLDRISGTGYVAVHDGVRPLVTPDVIARSFELARKYKTAVASMPLKESIRELTTPGSDSSKSAHVLHASVAVDRTRYRMMQTPQTFEIDLLKSAYASVNEENLTDDASVVEQSGQDITLFDGSYENLKITTPEDVIVAEAIVRSRMQR